MNYPGHYISNALIQNLLLQQIELIQSHIKEKEFSIDEFLYQAGEKSEELSLIQE